MTNERAVEWHKPKGCSAAPGTGASAFDSVLCSGAGACYHPRPAHQRALTVPLMGVSK